MKHRSLLIDESGNLVVIMPMVAALVVAGMLLWNFNMWRATTGQGTRAALDLRRIALSILNRTKTVIAAPGGPVVSPSTASNYCDAAHGSTINGDLAKLRNFSLTGQSYTYSYTYGGSNNLGTTCLLLDTDLPTTTELYSATVVVTLVPNTDDLINLSRQIDISVHVASDPSNSTMNAISFTHEQAQTFDIDQVVTLEVQRLADYGLVLFGTPASGAAITAPVSVTFASPVYWLAPSQAITGLVTAAQQANVKFLKSFDYYATAITSASTVSMATLKQVFAGGMRLSVHNTDTTTFPLNGTGVPLTGDSGPTTTAWNQFLNLTNDGAGNLAPVPNMNPASTADDVEPTITSAIPSLGAGPATETTTVGGGTDPYNNTGLYHSCNTGTGGAVGFAPLVYMDTTPAAANNFTINMDSAPLGDGVACGFIAADTVTFNLSGSGPNYFFGTIIARKLVVVSANETLVIGSPYHNNMGIYEALSGTTFGWAGQPFSMDLLRNAFATESQIGPARNFFVPFMRYTPVLSDTSVRFRPSGTLSIYTTGNGAITTTIPGTVVPNGTAPCSTPANLQNQACDTDEIGSLQLPFTAPAVITQLQILGTAATQNSLDLFGANATNDDLVFQVVGP